MSALIVIMGETLGIAVNVFEKAERERDRKERMKKLEEWKKERSVRMKRASVYARSDEFTLSLLPYERKWAISHFFIYYLAGLLPAIFWVSYGKVIVKALRFPCI